VDGKDIEKYQIIS